MLAGEMLRRSFDDRGDSYIEFMGAYARGPSYIPREMHLALW